MTANLVAYNSFLYTDNHATSRKAAKLIIGEAVRHRELMLLATKVRSITQSVTIATACVNKSFDITINGVWFDSLSMSQQKAVLLHELFHPILSHFTRQKAARVTDGKGWNIAGDMVINTLVATYGHDVSFGVLPPDDYNGPLLTEALLQVAMDSTPSGQIGSAGNGCGIADSAPGDQPMTPQEGQALARQVRALAGQGSFAKAFDRSLDAPLKVPQWRKYITQTYATVANSKRGATYQTYARPKVRGGLLMPRYTGGEPTIALVIDSSGSMTDKARNEIVKCAVSLSATYPNVKTLVVTHTDRVEFVGYARAGTMAVIASKACSFSGGTYVKPAYDEVAKRLRKADVIIHATDCEIESVWPKAPAKKLIVVDWGSGHGTKLPEGATRIRMELDT
jgi:predicted metal-dependent peptidase